MDGIEELLEPAGMPEANEQEAAVPAAYEQGENLALKMSAEYLTALGARVVTDNATDAESSKGWKEQVKAFLQLYNGETGDVGATQENITPVHLPYFTRAVQLFKSKLFPHLYPLDGELIALKTAQPAEKAMGCAEYMNYQLDWEIRDYRKSCDRAMDRFLIEGCIFETWFADYATNTPKQLFVRADDLNLPYLYEINSWDMSDVPRKSWVKRVYRHELDACEAAGYYTNVTAGSNPIFATPDIGIDKATGAVTGGGSVENETGPVKQVDDRATGQEKGQDDLGMRLLIEQDRWLLLPGEKAQRMVTVCVDQDSSKILRLALCEMPDPKDAIRHMGEQEQNAAIHASNMADHAGQMDQWQAEAEAMGGSHVVPPPAPPEPPAEPVPPRFVPWHRWTVFPCFENPGGAYGQGIGHRIAGFNMLANKVATRAVSLATLNLLPTGIRARTAFGDHGQTEIALGKIIESKLTPDQVVAGAGIKLFQFPPPDSNWFKIIEMCDKSCQELTAYNIASGGQGMSGETATEVETRNTNAHDTISMVSDRWSGARGQSLRNLAYLNSQLMPPEGVTVGGRKVKPQDFLALLQDMSVRFTCDQRVDSQAVREKRSMKTFQTLIQMASQAVGPVPLLDPQTGVKVVRAAAVNVLEAMKADPKLIADIKNAPMPNSQPPGGPPEGGEPPQMQQPPQGEENGPGTGEAPPAMDQSAGNRPITPPLG